MVIRQSASQIKILLLEGPSNSAKKHTTLNPDTFLPESLDEKSV